MSDEFQKKLAEIADRAKAAKQKASNAAAELEAARVAKVNAAHLSVSSQSPAAHMVAKYMLGQGCSSTSI